MNRLSNIIDEEIMLIEAEMEDAKKHVMKTDTLKERVLLQSSHRIIRFRISPSRNP